MNQQRYDCLGENKLPWFFDIERGVGVEKVKTYHYVQDDNEHVATLCGDSVVDVEPGFKTSDKRIQELVDNYYQDLIEENKYKLIKN